MKKIIIFSLIILFFTKTQNVFSSTNTFTVDNIEVTGTINDQNYKNRQLETAFRKGFEKLISSIVKREDQKELFSKERHPSDNGIIEWASEVINYLDNIEFKFLPLKEKCKKLSIDIQFICFPKDLLKNFEQLFLKQQIIINKFICSSYVKSFDFKDSQKILCERGKNIVKGINKQEVVSIPRTVKKKGFFEKLFHFFR